MLGGGGGGVGVVLVGPQSRRPGWGTGRGLWKRLTCKPVQAAFARGRLAETQTAGWRGVGLGDSLPEGTSLRTGRPCRAHAGPAHREERLSGPETGQDSGSQAQHRGHTILSP